MGKHRSFAMEFAVQGYDNAVDAALAEKEGTDASFSMAMASLEDAFQFLLSTLEDAREYATQQTALQLEEMDRITAEWPLVIRADIGADIDQPPVRADNEAGEQRDDTGLSQIRDVGHLSDAEFEKLLGYQKYILDHQNRKI